MEGAPSSAEASLSRMEAGEGKKKAPLSALAIFRLLSFLLGYPAGARLQAVSCFSFESQFESMCEGQDMSSGGATPHMKGMKILVRNFELKP